MREARRRAPERSSKSLTLVTFEEGGKSSPQAIIRDFRRNEMVVRTVDRNWGPFWSLATMTGAASISSSSWRMLAALTVSTLSREGFFTFATRMTSASSRMPLTPSVNRLNPASMASGTRALELGKSGGKPSTTRRNFPGGGAQGALVNGSRVPPLRGDYTGSPLIPDRQPLEILVRSVPPWKVRKREPRPVEAAPLVWTLSEGLKRSTHGKAPLADPVVVVDYNPAWVSMFALLRDRLAAALGDLQVTIDHVGSTAVPGAAAKPIIDIDVAVQPKEEADAAIRLLENAGYRHLGDLGIPGREAFESPHGLPEHHPYVVVKGNSEHTRHLFFRDYLREHPEETRRYSDLKKSLAAKFRDDREAYTGAKGAFVVGVLREASR